MKYLKNKMGLAISVVTVMGASSGLQAQSGRTATIEEVVVTATRREQSLQEVAVAVSNLSADDLVIKGIESLSDIEPGVIPSVIFQKFAGSPGALTIMTRGVGSADGVQGTQESPVPVYIDGVFLGRAQGLGIDLLDPERIEVLRGPQGQLFGRNAEAGAVQFVSRKPTGEFGVRASASYGNYDAQRYKIAVDFPEFAGFSGTLSALSTEHDAFTEQNDNPLQFNPLTGTVGPQTYVPPEPSKGYGLLDAEGYRAALRWQSEDGDITVDYSYDDSDLTDTQAYTQYVPLFKGTVPAYHVPANSGFPDETWDNTFHKPFETEASGHALTVEWRLSDAITLKSITATRETARNSGSTLGASLIAGAGSNGVVMTRSNQIMDAEQESQEVQFIGTWDTFELTAGAVYFNEDVVDIQTSEFTGPGLSGGIGFGAAAPVINHCVANNLDPCTSLLRGQSAETDSLGLYAQGSYRPPAFDDRLELILGLRYSDDEKTANRDRVEILGMDQGVNLNSKFEEQRWDPAVTVRYQWTDDLSTYIRYATAYRAGGANVRSATFTSYDQEENETWEIGLKSRWFNNSVQLNLALYDSTIEGEQVGIQEDPAGNPSLTNTVNNPEEIETRGAELELLWLATDSLEFGANMAFIDADDFYDFANPFSSNGQLVRIYRISTPEHSGSVFANYRLPLAVGNMNLNASYTWADNFATTPSTIPVAAWSPDYNAQVGSSSKWNARLAWSDLPVGEGRVEIVLWGKNLDNDSGAVFNHAGCAAGQGMCYYAGDPRTYGLEVRYEY